MTMGATLEIIYNLCQAPTERPPPGSVGVPPATGRKARQRTVPTVRHRPHPPLSLTTNH